MSWDAYEICQEVTCEGKGGQGRGMVRVAFFFAFGVLLRCAELHSDCED